MTPKADQGLSCRCSAESVELSSEGKKKLRDEKGEGQGRGKGSTWSCLGSSLSLTLKIALRTVNCAVELNPLYQSAIDDLSFLEEREERERSWGTVTFSVKATSIC